MLFWKDFADLVNDDWPGLGSMAVARDGFLDVFDVSENGFGFLNGLFGDGPDTVFDVFGFFF